MSGPARTGVLLYAKDLALVSAFYERVLGARVVHSDPEHRVLQSPDVQLIVYAIPRQVAEGIVIGVPPVPRENQAIKPFFTVESLAVAETRVRQTGGRIWGPVWPGPCYGGSTTTCLSSNGCSRHWERRGCSSRFKRSRRSSFSARSHAV